MFFLLDINGGFKGKLVIQAGGGGRGGNQGRQARSKDFREKKAKQRKQQKAARLEAAKVFVRKVDKVSQYHLMTVMVLGREIIC